MKKLLSLLLVAALALTVMSACGRNNDTKAPPGEADAIPDKSMTGPDAGQQNGSGVENDPEGFAVVCEPAEDGGGKGQVFDLATEKRSEEAFEIRPLLIRVTDGKGDERFRFLAKLWCAKGMRELWQNEHVTPYPSRVAARRGSAWLLSIGTEPEGNGSWLLYDEDAETLSLLAACERMQTLGDCILLHSTAYSDEFLTPLQVFDWSGRPVRTYEDTADFRLCGDSLYLLAGQPTRQLLRVPAESFTGPADLAPETLCALTGFFARFSYEEGEEDVMRLTPVEGRKLTCPIPETPLYVGGKEGENLRATGRVKESCAMFSVTLPDFWEGKYILEREPDELIFRHKASAESPDRAEYGDLLFSLSLHEVPDDVEKFMSGDSACELCRLYTDGAAYDVSLSEPGDMDCPPECREEYLAMRAALLGSPLYLVEEHIEAAQGGRVEQYDYSGLIGEYTGTDGIGSTYTLTVTDARRNVLQAEIGWHTAENPFPGEYATAEIRLFGSDGVVYWEAPNAFYDEGEGYRADYGGGFFRAQDDGTVLFRMNGQGDTWTTTDGYLTLTRG